MRDLATKVRDGSVVLDQARLRGQGDGEVIAMLAEVRGIGTWTAQMFLIFQLRRLDGWPTGDLGVRKGFGLAWGMPTPTPKQLEALGDPYRVGLSESPARDPRRRHDEHGRVRGVPGRARRGGAVVQARPVGLRDGQPPLHRRSTDGRGPRGRAWTGVLSR